MDLKERKGFLTLSLSPLLSHLPLHTHTRAHTHAPTHTVSVLSFIHTPARFRDSDSLIPKLNPSFSLFPSLTLTHTYAPKHLGKVFLFLSFFSVKDLILINPFRSKDDIRQNSCCRCCSPFLFLSLLDELSIFSFLLSSFLSLV